MTAGTIGQSRPLIRKNKNPYTPNLLIHLVKRFGFLFSLASISPKLSFSAKLFKHIILQFDLIMKKHFLIFTALAFCFILFTNSLAAQVVAPPKEKNKREAHLIELVKLDSTIKLDIRYATENNFVGKPVYPEARAFLQKPAAEALLKVHKKLKKKNLGLVIYDGYRPWTITKLFWEVVREDQRKFVANPEKGSKHNRGCAVDLGVYDLKTGEYLEMPSGYDEFTERASPDYKGGTEKTRENRDMLRKMMEDEGFTVNPNEWWHFDYKNWEKYAIYDIAFSEIKE